MKIAISYPPLENNKGVPLLSQNRQFQWFCEPTYVYPIVPAYALTLLSKSGYDVLWDDGIAEEKSYDKWLDDLAGEEPDLVAIETKTPVVKKHWKIIDDLKERIPKAKVILMGDHVTALPLESFENSKVDFVITGGDYDFMLLSLAKWLEGKSNPDPGIYYKEDGKVKNTGKFELNYDLNSLPFIDRDLTKWWLYAYKNGNYKRTPGTYTMVGRDCWHRKDGGCTFCAWTVLYPKYKVRKPELLVEEVGMLVDKYKVKEIFDDTGTFPAGNWLKRFCNLMIEKGYNDKIYFSCNMRFGVLEEKDYGLMAKAGFRMLLFGLESASDETLAKINKNLTVDRIKEELKWASQAGLEPHITIMVGYPWEGREDAMRTVKLARWLFEKGYACTLQATIVVPYPGTRMFEECKERGLLVTEDWDEYDMRKLVIKAPIDEEDVKELTQELYKSFFTPKYILRRILSVRNFDDLKFAVKGAKKVLGHLKDFAT